jgi:hypothetical protein
MITRRGLVGAAPGGAILAGRWPQVISEFLERGFPIGDGNPVEGRLAGSNQSRTDRDGGERYPILWTLMFTRFAWR